MRKELITDLRCTLKDSADPKTFEASKRFYKQGEEALVYGIRMGEISKIGKEFYRQLKQLSKEEIFAICEELWKSQYLEEAVIACICTESMHAQYEPADFYTFEYWVNTYVNNWADCDTLCNHTIGTFVRMYPDYIRKIKKWAYSSGRWVKRASAVTLILPARKGMFLSDIFEIADILISDKDDMVQKGYGWMLKAASQAHQQEVFEYLMSKKAIMPRTAFRYAIEKLPKEMKEEAMRKENHS